MLASTPFNSSSAVYEWISGFINLERHEDIRKIRLERMQVLVKAAGHPEKYAPSIHVAGSKGKGSVTGIIASILEAGRIKTARYASPHVSDFRERLGQGSSFFDEEIYSEAGNELMAAASSLSGEDKPTFFELMTLWFFLCARLSRCEALAVETGLGGRLDATNILDPLLSVITLIELEHTDLLGDTIAAIAGEKAGIVKPGRPLVLAEQKPEALDVFRKHAKEKSSPLIYFPESAEVKDIKIDREGSNFTLVLQDDTLTGLHIPVPGEVQVKNAGLAVLAVKTAFPQITNDAIRKGLAGFSLPGRFERISARPEIIIDGAHTGRSIEHCIDTFTSLYGRNGILIFGCAAGKDTAAMAALCVPFFSKIIITTPGTFKKSKPEEIYSLFKTEAQKCYSPPAVHFIPDTAEAVKMAKETAIKSGLPVLGTGSFYLAGEIRSIIGL